MALLRTAKFCRSVVNFVRFSSAHVPGRPRFFTTAVSPRAMVMPASQPTPNSSGSDLEKTLRRLDQDVRRSGRISQRELEEALSELKLTSSATSSQSLLMIRCCGSLVPEEPPDVRSKLVEEIWSTLSKLGVKMDISHYNALLRVYLENEYNFSPTQFLARLAAEKIEPNRVTYQRLLARHCQQADMDGAAHILQQMRENHWPINEAVFHALITGHCRAGDTTSANGILDVMAQAGLEPSTETYTVLLCGLAQLGETAGLEKILQDCKSKDISLSDRDYFELVYALAVNKQADHVDKVLNLMPRSMGYNVDATNLVLRLVTAGQVGVAEQILHTMPRATQPDGKASPVGAFFVRHLVQTLQSSDVILETCQRMEESGLNDRALLIATERSLQLGRVDQAFTFLKALKERGLPLRQHYVWPLLTQLKSVPTVLQRSVSELGLLPGAETLRDHVIPRMGDEDVIGALCAVGVSPGSACSALVLHQVSKDQLREAAETASRHRAKHNPVLLRRPMSSAYCRTKDTASYVALLRHLHRTDEQPAELVGAFLVDVAYTARNDRQGLTAELLKALVEEGLSMSTSMAARLEERLGQDVTAEISSLITQLTAGDLVPVVGKSQSAQPSQDLGSLERARIALEGKGESSTVIKKRLLSAYCRRRDFSKAEEVKLSLERDNVTFSSGLLAQLIEMHASNDQLDSALKYKTELNRTEPGFRLDQSKIVKLAGLLINEGRFEDGIHLLESEAHPEAPTEQSFNYTTNCWRILNGLAELGKLDELQRLFSVLTENNYINVTNILLGPLVKVHIVREDLPAAMTELERCVQTYRVTPWKNELTCKLIAAENAEALQKLTDLSTAVHGEVNSLYDLVFAFIECGRLRQAKKILETPGLGSRPQRITSACRRYQQEGLVTPLEGLISVTKNLPHVVDRAEIYGYLLDSYNKTNDVEKAVGLWTQMQEEDVAISEQFLRDLASLMERNGQKASFAVPPQDTPKMHQSEVLHQKPRAVRQPKEARQPNEVKKRLEILELRRAVKDGDLQAATDAKKSSESKGEELSATDLSLLLELMVREGKLIDGVNLVTEMLQKKVVPVGRVFRYLLTRLANEGDITNVEALGALLTAEDKKKLAYDNRLCLAHTSSGKGRELLDKLKQEIDNAASGEVKLLGEKFPKGGCLAILQRNPELVPQMEELARTYAVHGETSPINVLWMHLFVAGKDSEAGQIWCEFLARSSHVLFQHVVQTCRRTADSELATRLVNQLKGSSLSPAGLGNAYSCLLDVLVSRGELDLATSTVEDALKDIPLENLNVKTLTSLKNALEADGKTFKHIIPSKIARIESDSDSSSSSSDDEKPRK